MTLGAQLQGAHDDMRNTAPKEVMSVIDQAAAEMKRVFDPTGAIQVGDRFPEFRLQNATGVQIDSKDLLAPDSGTKGLLISFYRGEWCPYCNLELRALQQHQAEFEARGVKLVAVSPELPDQSLSTQEKNELTFNVLSDVDNALATKIGIRVPQADVLKGFFQKVGVDFEARTGSKSLDVPIPATFLIDRDSIVLDSFMDPDWTRRLEPETALQWIDAKLK